MIDKGIAGPSLLSIILADKYLDHLPLYRQKQRIARENIQIPSSTIEGWTKQALEKLEPLYEQLMFKTKTHGYLQVDDTPIKVLDSDKKGAAHQGYYWVYHAPLEGIVLFDYSPTGGIAAVPMQDVILYLLICMMEICLSIITRLRMQSDQLQSVARTTSLLEAMRQHSVQQ